MDFLGGAVDKNPSANAGDTGLTPSPGRFHRSRSNQVRASHLLNKGASTTNPVKPENLQACTPKQDKPSHDKVCTTQLENSLHLPNKRKAWAKQQKPSTVKNNNKKSDHYVQGSLLHEARNTRREKLPDWKQSEWKAAAAAKSLQSCPTLCDTIDGSPSGSTVPGILGH